MPGSTDIGTAIIYAIAFVGLFLNASRQGLRGNDTMGKECGGVKTGRKYDSPITLPRLDTATLTELRQRYKKHPMWRAVRAIKCFCWPSKSIKCSDLLASCYGVKTNGSPCAQAFFS